MFATTMSKPAPALWQGETRDGYTLRLTRSGLAKIASNLKRTGLHTLVQNNLNGNRESAIARAIAQVARNATHSGSGQHTLIFTAVGKTRKYQIVARPIDHQHSEVLGVRSQPIQEFEYEDEFEHEYEDEYDETEYFDFGDFIGGAADIASSVASAGADLVGAPVRAISTVAKGISTAVKGGGSAAKKAAPAAKKVASAAKKARPAARRAASKARKTARKASPTARRAASKARRTARKASPAARRAAHKVAPAARRAASKARRTARKVSPAARRAASKDRRTARKVSPAARRAAHKVAPTARRAASAARKVSPAARRAAHKVAPIARRAASATRRVSPVARRAASAARRSVPAIRRRSPALRRRPDLQDLRSQARASSPRQLRSPALRRRPGMQDLRGQARASSPQRSRVLPPEKQEIAQIKQEIAQIIRKAERRFESNLTEPRYGRASELLSSEESKKIGELKKRIIDLNQEIAELNKEAEQRRQFIRNMASQNADRADALLARDNNFRPRLGYHMTPSANMTDIRATGLDPARGGRGGAGQIARNPYFINSSQGRVHYTDDLGTAGFYGNFMRREGRPPEFLGVRNPASRPIEIDPVDSRSAYRTSNRIPPDHIVQMGPMTQASAMRFGRPSNLGRYYGEDRYRPFL